MHAMTSTGTSSVGGAQPGRGGYSMCTMRALQVDRLQRRRAAETGEDRDQRSQLGLAPPNGIRSYFCAKLLRINRVKEL